MPRKGSRKQSKIFHKPIKKNAPPQHVKKFKHIQRAKESEELLLRQQKMSGNQQTDKPMDADSSDSSDSDDNTNVMDQLLMSLKSNKRPNEQNINNLKRAAIESSDSEDEENENDSDQDKTDSDQDDQHLGTDDELDDNDDDQDVDDDQGDAEDDDQDDNILDKKEKRDKIKKKLKADDDIESDELENQIENDEYYSDDNNDDDSEDTEIKDMFTEHFNHSLSLNMLECVTKNTTKPKIHKLDLPQMGPIQFIIPSPNQNVSAPKKLCLLLSDETTYASEGSVPQGYETFDIRQVKQQIQKHLRDANGKCLKTDQTNQILTPLQTELFSFVNNYQDFYYPKRNLQNGEEIRLVYCLHALNHILRTRARIITHNTKLSKLSGRMDNQQRRPDIIPDTFRDQGLFRPKVVILVPFKDSAFRIINILISLIFPQLGATVMNYKKFLTEFTGQTLYFPKRTPKPEDYEQTFVGNTDDMFRIGLCITRKCLKLYSSFYASDIIIASPLGLRSIVGAAGDPNRDFDYLNSIELLIVDQAEIMFAQNWEHLTHVLNHFHLQPKSTKDTDLSRVRTWCLNGWSPFYRQTLLFSAHELPEFRALFNSKCLNYRGKSRAITNIECGTIRHVAVDIRQEFKKIVITSIEKAFDERFNYFVRSILPNINNPQMARCLIYISSYFDFVRIRNYFKRENINFVQINEYTKDEKIARARDMFFHGSAHFLLYTERAHYFRRTRIKGIRHLVFYQPPSFPRFYSEMINLMQEANQNPRDGCNNSMSTITTLYTKYDMLQVANILGTERAQTMLERNNCTHVFTTGDVNNMK